MNPVLVTGGSGQVGTALQRLGGGRIIAPARDRLDITSESSIEAALASQRWSVIVNCAAFTAVDRAESERDAAWAVNAAAPAALARAAALRGIPVIHLSTDYVFNGSKGAPYVEDDPVAPIGVYGASKEAGERGVRDANPRHVILRTAWVVSASGSNFVKTMIRLARERPVVGVVADQTGCPTGAADIAAAVLTIVAAIDRGAWQAGTYHFCNAGETSWYGLAAHVFARLCDTGRQVPVLEALTTADYPTAARRPADSRLATGRITRQFGIVPRDWRTAIDEVIDQLLENEQ